MTKIKNGVAGKADATLHIKCKECPPGDDTPAQQCFKACTANLIDVTDDVVGGHFCGGEYEANNQRIVWNATFRFHYEISVRCYSERCPN